MEEELKTDNKPDIAAEPSQENSPLTEPEVSATSSGDDMRELKKAVREMQSDIRDIKQGAVQEQGMKWYKFLIYFLLFAGAVLNSIFGIMAMTGAQYVLAGVEAELVYDTFPGMKSWDMFNGVMCIIVAVFGVVTRFMLSSHRKIGPLFLYILYGAGIVVSIIYIVGATSVVGEPLVDASTIGSLIGSAVMIVVNIIYFQKRKHIFNK